MKKELKNKIAVLEKVFEWKEDKERKKGENGYYIISDKTPKEIKDILFRNDFEIDDYNYEWFNDAFSQLVEAIEEAKDVDEAFHIVENFDFDIEPDIYTSNLTEWLNSSNYRVEYLGEAVRELGSANGFEILTHAQYIEMREVFDNARRSFEEYLSLTE